MDRGVWWATVHGIAQSWTQLSDFTFTLDPHAPWKDQHHLFKKFYLCIFACTGSSLLYAGFLQLWVGSSLQWLLLLWSAGSRHTSFSVGGMWPWLPWGTWSLPGPRFEPLSLALAGEFLTAGPPGKSLHFTFVLRLLVMSFGPSASDRWGLPAPRPQGGTCEPTSACCVGTLASVLPAWFLLCREAGPCLVPRPETSGFTW